MIINVVDDGDVITIMVNYYYLASCTVGVMTMMRIVNVIDDIIELVGASWVKTIIDYCITT